MHDGLTAVSRGGSRISEVGGANIMFGWLRKAKLVTTSYSVRNTHVLSMGVWGHAPTEKFTHMINSYLPLILFLKYLNLAVH